MIKKWLYQWAPVLGLMLLLGLTVLAYLPALFHVARADQVSFLAEYAGRENNFQMIIDSLFYNRTREFSPGDAALFRPLLFLMLSVQKAVFGYGPFWWQLVALLAHLFTVGALWRLLRRWSGEVRAYHAAAWLMLVFFAVLFTNMEAVIWHGITPYVFFAGFILLAMDQLDVFICSQGRNRRAVWACAAWLLAAVLIYEAGIIYILCFTGYTCLMLRGTGRVRWSLAVLAPLIVYTGWSAGHWFLAGIHPDAETGQMLSQAFSLKTVRNYLMVLKWFVAGAFFFQPQDITRITRLIADPVIFTWPWPFNDWLAVRWFGMAGVAALGVSIGMGTRFIADKVTRGRVLLLCTMLLGYIAMLTIGRTNTREDGTGVECSYYYFYNFWVLLSVLLYLPLREFFARQVVLRWIAAFALVIFAGSNAWSVYRMTASIAVSCRDVRIAGIRLDKFVAQHRNEKDFTFYMAPGEPGNYFVIWLSKKNDPPGKRYSLIEALYPKYFNATNPKYRIHSRR
jgi:hypothetical protein